MTQDVSSDNMERWDGKVAVVTGASVGIGAAIATQLVKNGLTVIGCSRKNTDKIESLSQELSSESGKLVARRCDVRQEQEVKEVFQFARTQFGGVDVCVNNAGLAHWAPILTGSTEEWREMLEVNVLGVCVFTREFMTQLKERGVDQGHIININSMSGHRLTDSMHFYSASKHALTAINEGVRRELREMKSNVKMTSISPGAVKTEFMARSDGRDDIEASKKEYDTMNPYGPSLEADDIASAVLFALSTPPRMEVNEMYVRPIGQTK